MVIPSVVLDRLLHHRHVLNVGAEICRLRDKIRPVYSRPNT